MTLAIIIGKNLFAIPPSPTRSYVIGESMKGDASVIKF